MRTTLLFLFMCSLQLSFAQEDFTLRINDKHIPVGLDQQYEVIINGQKTKISLRANDTLTYNDEFVSFRYTKDYKISKTAIDDGIEQLMLMTADGTGVVIQKYSSMSPTTLNNLMMTEVTKESVSYGFVMKREDYKLTIGGDKVLEVDRAVLRYKDETNIYEIATAGKKDSGVLIMTMKMDDIKESKGQKLIDLMWKTLLIK